MNFRAKALAALTLLALLGGASQAMAAQYGGTLVIARDDPPPCLDPQQSTSHSTLIVGRSIADQLTDQDPATGKIVPWLATGWQVNDDATAYIFTLRQDASFSDGTPVDAAAVKANFDGIRDLGAKAALGASYIAGYTGSDILDPYRIRVNFKTPNRQFLQATTTMSLGIYAPSLYKVSPPDRCLGKGLIGSGPFVLTSFVPDQEIVIEGRKGYNWPSALRTHTGEAYLDKVDFPLVKESSVRIGGLISGDFDATTVNPPDEPAVAAAGLQFAVRPNPGVVNALFPNEKRPIVSEKPVRQAIQKALDRNEIINTVYTDRYHVATSPLSSSTPGWVDYGDLLKFDPDGARKLLDDDGWKVGPDGIRVRNGQKLELNVIANSNSPLLQLVQQQLRNVGIQLDLKIVNDIFAAQATLDYDFFSWSFTRADADALRTVFGAANPARRGQAYNDKLDGFLERAASTADPQQRQQAVSDAQREIIESADAILINENNQLYGLAQSVQNFTFESSARLSLYDVWKAQ